jgi:hypothetical protein
MSLWTQEIADEGMGGHRHTGFAKKVKGVYKPKRLQDEGVGEYKHREFGKRVEGVYRPKRLLKGWVGTNTQTLGKYYQLAQT